MEALPDDPFTLETHTASDGYRWQYRRYAAVRPRVR